MIGWLTRDARSGKRRTARRGTELASTDKAAWQVDEAVHLHSGRTHENEGNTWHELRGELGERLMLFALGSISVAPLVLAVQVFNWLSHGVWQKITVYTLTGYYYSSDVYGIGTRIAINWLMDANLAFLAMLVGFLAIGLGALVDD